MKKNTMKPVGKNAKEWMKRKAFRDAYNTLGPEYTFVSALIEARVKANLSQKELARRMKTTQPMIARMESGRQVPSAATLLKVAKATGTRLQIKFVTA